MNILIKSLVFAVVLTLVPFASTQAESTTMGPLTVTNLTFSATPLAAGTTVNIYGSGWLNVSTTNLVPISGSAGNVHSITPTTNTDSQFSFKIPSSIVAGTYTLQFVTNENYGRIFSYNNQTHYFVIGLGSATAPVVTSVSPSTGTIGSKVYITGSGFSSQISLYFYSTNRTITDVLKVSTSNNGTAASFTIPDWLYAGYYTFTVNQSSGVSSAQALTVSSDAPYLTSISPLAGPAGTEVTITGKNFSGSNTVSYSSSFSASGVENYIPSSNGGTTLKFITPTTLSVGVYNIAVSNLNGSSDYLNFQVTSTQVAEKHPEGTNVVAPDGTVYRMMGNGRNPYTSAGAFTSYKFNTFATTVPANSFDLSLPVGSYTPTGSTTAVPYYIPPRNGALINDKGTVYLITGGLRAGFASEAAFKGMGYAYSNVYPGDTSFMVTLAPINSSNQKHPNGTLINDNGTLYVMKEGSRIGIPSMAILDSWGYWVSEAVPANSYDRAAPVTESMQTRMDNQMNI